MAETKGKIIKEIVNFRCVLYKDDTIKIEKSYPMESKSTTEEIVFSVEECKTIEKILNFIGA